ncbi:MAG: cation:proton antiporter [Fusobacteriota bacterium]
MIENILPKLPVTDPVLIFLIVMSIVLIAPILAEKLKLPGIIGLITFGIIVGPHALDILENNTTIELLGTIGLLYIMFQAGLEINLGEVKKNKHHSIFFGLLTFLIPLILGTVTAYFYLNMNLVASVLLSSMFSSHTLITFPIVSKMGLAKKSSITSAIGGTIITDTLAFLILAVVVAINSGDMSIMFWIKFIILVIITVSITIKFLPVLARWFFRKYSSELDVKDYVFVITVLFLSAHIFHKIGLEHVIGAFLSGLVLNSLIPEKSVLMNRIKFVGDSLFIPFFLISVGMLINVRHFISGRETLKVSLTMIVLGIVSKYIAAHLFGKIAKFKKSENNLIFAITVNQAAATLAAVMVGVRLDIFDNNILTGTVAMIMVTSFVGSIFTEKFARQVARESEDDYEVEDHKILDRILIPIKNSKNLEKIMEFSLLIKEPKNDQPVYPLNVALEGKDTEKQILRGENLLTKTVAIANSMQKSANPINKIDINVSKAISKSVKEQRISKVVFGCKDLYGSQHYLFNSVVDQFIRNSHETTYIANFKHPLGISEKIFIIVPTFMNKQKGFANTFKSIIQLAIRINTKLIIVSDETALGDIKKIISKKKSTLEYDFLTINSWKKIYDTLVENVDKNDMLVQMIARQDQIAWKLSSDRMPRKLRSFFPNNNIIVVYPYYDLEEDRYIETSESETIEVPLLKNIPEDNFSFKVDYKDIERVLDDISKNNYNEYVYNELISVLKESPIELTHDVLLIHIHTTYVEDFEIYFYVNEDQFETEYIESNPKIVITLLSPKYGTLKDHLKKLSEIAKLSSNDRFIDNLIEAENYNNFIKLSKEDKNELGLEDKNIDSNEKSDK